MGEDSGEDCEVEAREEVVRLVLCMICTVLLNLVALQLFMYSDGYVWARGSGRLPVGASSLVSINPPPFNLPPLFTSSPSHLSTSMNHSSRYHSDQTCELASQKYKV